MINVIPAIDILDGKVVRLLKGDFNIVTNYSDSPVEVAMQMRTLGFRQLHLIHLDGARDSEKRIDAILSSISQLKMDVQIGGGIRSLEAAQHYISLGAKRIIMSTAALEDPEIYHATCSEIGKSRAMISLDLNNEGYVALHGWKQSLNMTLEEAIDYIGSDWISNLIITDISKDGTLGGVDSSLYRSIHEKYPEIRLFAAGGVSDESSIHSLEQAGVSGAIVGRAFYENDSFRKKLRAYA